MIAARSRRVLVAGALSALLTGLSTSLRALEPSPLLAVDQNRAALVERTLQGWRTELQQQFGSAAAAREMALRQSLEAMRADRLLAASLADPAGGIAATLAELDAQASAGVQATKALGDPGTDVTYVPVTPCRLVETRTSFAAVYHAGGAFTPNQIRTYTVHGGNGVCLAQLPATLHPAAVQLQVFGLPTTSASGDIEILPQGGTFGSTATMVYLGGLSINTVSTAAKVNTANDQISVQVRGGGAHLAIDVVGYFSAPAGTGGQFFRQGGNAFGAVAKLGTLDAQPFDLYAGNQRGLRIDPTANTPHVIGGYVGNSTYAGLTGATIAGGGAVGAQNAPAPGGSGNQCSLAQGCINEVINSYGAIGGGAGNLAGGANTPVGGIFATVSGGLSNWAFNVFSSVSGGVLNVASGPISTVLGGYNNQATADFSTVVGGSGNTAGGAGSLSAGMRASAPARGEFVWADNSVSSPFDPGSYANGWSDASNTFNVRATGGVWFVTGTGGADTPTSGCSIGPGGGAWSCTSSRDVKTDFEATDSREVLRKVMAMPIERWRFKTEPDSVRHVGPMAQDFYAAFGLGHDPLGITTSDATGIALAAIQGLRRLIDERDARIDALQHEVDGLRGLREELDALRRIVLSPRAP